jgi:outer membrane protein OmpA-like peptidoglycan-associated protein
MDETKGDMALRRTAPPSRGHSPIRVSLLLAPLWLLAACAGPPDNLFVLLENEDGSVGRIEVASAEGAQTLDTAREATGFNRPGQDFAEPFELTPEQIQTAFGDALSAQPDAPRVFLLYFRSDSTELTPDSAAELPTIIATVAARRAPDVSIVGHTDRSGSADYNMQLSLQRAQAVRDELAAVGLPLERTEVTSHGENNPLISTADDVREPRNRRVEVTVR